MNTHTTRQVGDWGGNVIAFLLMITANILANALPLGGQTTGEVSARYPSPFTPAGFTFSIWGLIYLALAGFVVFQALPGQRENWRIMRISRLFQVNCAANALWIFAWHYNYLMLSLLLMAVILLSLIAIYRALGSADSWEPVRERWILRAPVSLYTGWISVATIANISAVQTAMQWDYALVGATPWTLLKLAFAGALAAVVLLRRGDIIYALVFAWAAFGISMKQVQAPAVAGAATMLYVLILLLVAAQAVRGFRTRHRFTGG
jgi:hypothetical protein